MKNMKSIFSLGVLGLFLMSQGCAILHSVSVTRVPMDRSKPIQAEASGWGILGIYFNNDLVDEAVADLDSKCTGGKISGVMTKYSTRVWVLWTTRKVEVTGYCLAGNK